MQPIINQQLSCQGSSTTTRYQGTNHQVPGTGLGTNHQVPGAAGLQGNTFEYKVLKSKGKVALNSGAGDRANSEAPNKTCLAGLDIKEVISESQTQELWVVDISVKLHCPLSRVHLQFKSVTILTHDRPEYCLIKILSR